MSSSKDPQSQIPANSKGSWSSFLKSIASFNGDLSSLTAPPFILSSTSLVEYSAYWAEHPSLFVAPAQETDPEKRALAVLKWFLSTLHQQYCSRSEKLGSEKKPLNPFLGELFIGKWNGDENVGDTSLISEQVSHHPPATAYAITNDKHGVELQGYNAQKASFSSTIQIKQIGHALLTITPPGADKNDPAQQEQYLITLPHLHIESLIYGTPFVELEKTTKIVSSTGYVAKIDYSGKGWLSGKKNTFTASLFKESEGEKKPLYTAEGQWSEKFTIRNARTKEEVDKHVVKEAQTTPLQLAPLEQQDLFESRRAWSDVASSIERGDMDSVSAHKGRIENAQRELRKIEKSEGREWPRRFFKRLEEGEDDDRFKSLAQTIGLTTLEADKTGGVWRFDRERATGAQPPYHPVGPEGLGLSSN
ncbi:OSBP family protein [Aspergillus affinis]|uniref:OSBP family protein n=1 Tax=Aspergillus affinis TaxID=1070780 RepID=UPI0022FDC2B0|nr:Oxysterol-binding protein [Aspergillus affinis]KAI9041287.1 Oxysterol-binding protein [Aspergillus affinis]